MEILGIWVGDAKKVQSFLHGFAIMCIGLYALSSLAGYQWVETASVAGLFIALVASLRVSLIKEDIKAE